MPTAATCEAFETLKANIINLLDLKKLCDKQEAELRNLKNHKELLESGAHTPGSFSLSSGARSKSPTLMTQGHSIASLGAVPSPFEGKKVAAHIIIYLINFIIIIDKKASSEFTHTPQRIEENTSINN